MAVCLSRLLVSPGRKADVIRAGLSPSACCWVTREVLRAAFESGDAVAYLGRWRDHYLGAIVGGAGVAAAGFGEAIVAVRKKSW